MILHLPTQADLHKRYRSCCVSLQWFYFHAFHWDVFPCQQEPTKEEKAYHLVLFKYHCLKSPPFKSNLLPIICDGGVSHYYWYFQFSQKMESTFFSFYCLVCPCEVQDEMPGWQLTFSPMAKHPIKQSRTERHLENNSQCSMTENQVNFQNDY